MWIEYNKYKELSRKGITLDMCYILSLIKEGHSIWAGQGQRVYQIILALQRKGFIKDGVVTEEGKKIIEFLQGSGDDIGLAKIELPKDAFTLWWEKFPATDTFKYKGKVFSGCRGLRTKKDDCKKKLLAVLEEKEYTIEQLIAALDYEIIQKKEISLKSGENKMAYFRNSLTYINQRSWEPFIDLIKLKIVPREENVPTNSNSFGI